MAESVESIAVCFCGLRLLHTKDGGGFENFTNIVEYRNSPLKIQHHPDMIKQFEELAD